MKEWCFWTKIMFKERVQGKALNKRKWGLSLIVVLLFWLFIKVLTNAASAEWQKQKTERSVMVLNIPWPLSVFMQRVTLAFMKGFYSNQYLCYCSVITDNETLGANPLSLCSSRSPDIPECVEENGYRWSHMKVYLLWKGGMNQVGAGTQQEV